MFKLFILFQFTEYENLIVFYLKTKYRAKEVKRGMLDQLVFR
jgi:hypothetical protein